MKTSRVPITFCPFCGHTLDAATAGPMTPEATPGPGDVTLCVGCVNVLIFDDDLKARKPTPAELAEVMDYPEIRAGRLALFEAHRRGLLRLRPKPKPH